MFNSSPLENGRHFADDIRRQAIIWTNANLIYWRIYAALGGDDLIQMSPIPI